MPGLGPDIAATGITLAAITNTLVKGGLAAGVGGFALGKRVVPLLLAVLVAGGAALILVASF